MYRFLFYLVLVLCREFIVNCSGFVFVSSVMNWFFAFTMVLCGVFGSWVAK